MTEVATGSSFTKLDQTYFEKYAPKPKAGPDPHMAEMVAIMESMGQNEGGEFSLTGDKKSTVKARILRAANQVGRKIKFFRTDGDTIRFQVTETFDPTENAVEI